MKSDPAARSEGAFAIGDDVVISAGLEGRSYLAGRLTAIRRRYAIVHLDQPVGDPVSGEWLLLTRTNSGARWQDPVELTDIRLYVRSPTLRSPAGDHRLASTGTMRLVRSGVRGRDR